MDAKLPERGHPGFWVPWRSRLKESSGKGKILPRVRGIGPINRRDFLRLGGAGLAGATLLGVAGCGGGEQVGGGGGSGGSGGSATFTYGRGADSVSLDPVNATDGESFAVTRQIFDGILEFKPGTTDPVASLATEIPQPEQGGRRYTIDLREGVKFHDGSDFNAEAVVFNFDRWRLADNEFHKGGGNQTSNFAYYTSQFGGFDGDSIIANVEAVDEYTVRFDLKEPLGPFLRNLAMSAFAIASPTALEKNVEGFWENPVGTGPFEFDSWEKGSEVRLTANKDWWASDLPEEQGGGGPNVDTIVFRSITDNSSRVASLAINMEEVVKAFFGDTAQVATNAYPPTVPFWREATEPYGYDPDEAKKLMEEAGLGDGFDMDLWFMPIPRPYMPDGRGVAQAMQRDLEQVGINAKLVTREWGTYLEETSRGTHDAAMLGWSGDNGDPDNFLNVLLSSGSATEEDAQNIAYYKNPELDDILRQGATTVDENERRRLYEQAQEIIYNDAPWVPIVYAEVPLGYQDDVEGVTPNPVGNEEFTAVRFTGGGA